MTIVYIPDTCMTHCYTEDLCVLVNYAALSVSPSNCTDGDIRLVDGSVSSEGRLEICINRAWGTICYGNSRYGYNYWGAYEARVVCHQLGHQERGEC